MKTRLIAVFIVFILSLSWVAPVAASPSPSKILHIVFIVQENHSFDNYFGMYPGARGFPAGMMISANPNKTNSMMYAPYLLSVSQPINLIGDELPPGISDPNQRQSFGHSETYSRTQVGQVPAELRT